MNMSCRVGAAGDSHCRVCVRQPQACEASWTCPGVGGVGIMGHSSALGTVGLAVSSWGRAVRICS